MRLRLSTCETRPTSTTIRPPPLLTLYEHCVPDQHCCGGLPAGARPRPWPQGGVPAGVIHQNVHTAGLGRGMGEQGVRECLFLCCPWPTR